MSTLSWRLSRFFAFLLCLLATLPPAAAQPWSNGYVRRRTITIDHTKVPNTDQTNFPVLISGTYPYLATTGNGGNVTSASGYDIIFTSDATGTNTLAFERENYNPTTGAASFWISIPTLSHTTDTVFYMFYSNSSATTDQSNKTGVWDANYKGVWHFNQTPNGSGSELDSTSNGYNGTPASSGISLSSDGIAGSSLNFNGTSSANAVTMSSALPGTYPLTISTWLKTTGLNSTDYSTFMNKTAWPSAGWSMMDNGPSSSIVFFRTQPNWTADVEYARSTVNDGIWHHLVGTVDSSLKLSFYLDGVLKGTKTASSITADTADPVSVGGFGGNHGGGLLTEARISNTVRSADWIAAEYNNQSNSATFSSVGSDDSNAPSIANLSPTSGVIGTSITITGTNFGSTQGSSNVTFNGTTATVTNWSATSLTATVPSGAGSGYVVVTVSGTPSNGAKFKVTNGYSYFRAITIDHTKIPNTDQANFPVLISGTYSYLATTANSGNVTNANGYDIVFSPDAAGTSILDFEQESYNASTGAINYWVRIPTVSHSTDTIIYMFYGNSLVSTDQSNKVGVWDSNYALVSHMADNAANMTVADSTSNANNLFNQANTSNKTAAGKINNGLTYNGSSDSSSVANNPSLNIQGSAITLEVWAKPTNSTASSSERLIVKEVSGNTDPYVRYGLFRATSGSSQITFMISTGGSGSYTSVSGGSTSAGTWTHAVGVYNGSTLRLYVNGSSVGTATKTGNIGSSTTPLVLGADTAASIEYFNGVLDEARVSNGARSADWIAAEYNNQSGPSTFYGVGSAGSGTAGSPRITSLSPTSGPAGSSVTITGANFGSAQGSSTVAFNGTTATATTWSDSQVVVSVPSGASSGNAVITVSGVASNGLGFGVVPVIATLSPNSGAVGSSMTITGTAFGANQGSSTVTFNGTSASTTSWIATSIAVMVPAGATTGNVVVTVGGLASSGVSFGVAPAITTLSPTSGVVGTSVTITGTTFGATQGSSTVTFGGALASPTTWSNTSIVVPVPVGATPGNVVVTVGGLASSGISFSVTLGIASLSPPSGIPGTPIIIAGVGFGASQGSSTVKFNGTLATPTGWSDTSIVAPVPSGVTTGNVIVTVSGLASNGVKFTALPTGWLDQDVGSVPLTGSASYANGVFTVSGAGSIQQGSTVDKMHFVYRAFNGDGTIVARLASITGGNPDVGVMIRDTMDTGAANGFAWCCSYNNTIFGARVSTGAATSGQIGSANYTPQASWIKVVRSGSTITAYSSYDALNWTTLVSQSVTMGQNVYAGLVATSGSNTALTTATFDNVSVTSAASSSPVITSTSATTGSIGGSVVIKGSGFGATQGSSLVMLNGAPVTINSWSDTSITITIPAGATSGYLAALAGPSMNASNPVYFTVTSQPLPSGWFDRNLGGLGGSATYASGVYTVTSGGSGVQTNSSSDAGLHFVYQGLLGDGSIVARVASVTGANSGTQSGVMIRETLNPNASMAFAADFNSYGERISYLTRTSTGGTVVQQNAQNVTAPYWVKVAKSGTTFMGYMSSDGVIWTQVGSAVTISMAQNIYIGFGVGQGSASGPVTATFDNVSIMGGLIPFVASVSPNSASVGTSVTVTGSDFGATQGSSTLSFNGTVLSSSSITSWGDTQIVVTIPNTVTTGPVVVTVNGIQSNADVIFTALTPLISNLLPSSAPQGSSITVQGYNFGATRGNGTVQFNGIGGNVNSWSDRSVTVTVPSNATSGSVTLTANDGITSNAAQFNLIEATSITGISPSSGAYNTSVTITGTGFGSAQSNSVIAFYGVAATTITSWSDTQIVANVPVGTGSGKVSVTVAGITVQGPVFTVTSTAVTTDSLGHTSTYNASVIAGQWQLTNSTGSGCSTCTVRGVISHTYDSNGNILTTTDALGYVTTNTYDSANNLLSQTVPVTGTTTATTSYTYNSFGEALTVTDPLGHVTTNTYDSHGNLTSVTSPAPDGNTAASVTHFAYDAKGELTSITDPLSHVTTMTYTTAGLIATITDAQSNVTTYAYDSHGNRTSVTDALSHQTTFAYDTGDRLKTITYPDSTTSTFGYDSRGRKTSATDQNSKITAYAYDDADRLTSVTDAANNVTTYAYDTEDNLSSITDANSHVTYFTYDAFGRVTQTNFPSTLSENYAYDADNNLTSKTDRKSQTITYVYDAMNRLTHKGYPDSTGVDFVYDLVGKIQQVNDPTGTYAFAYDNMGRLLGTTTNYSFLTSRSFANAYTYDAASNRTGFTDPESGSTTYSYDTLNRLTSLAPPSAFGSGSFGFSYDALSRRTQMTRPNGVTTNYTYDNLSRLLSVLHQLSGSTIDGASYTVDSIGNRTTKTDQSVALTSNYTYDAIYELTQVIQGTNTTESYTYDAVGNHTTSLGVSSYTTNASNELTATPNSGYTYDSNGNTLTKTDSNGTTTYTWDFENRLASATLPGSGGTVNFKYDPFGRRIYKSSSTGTGVFAYDSDNIIEETSSIGVVVARYSQGLGVDEPLAMLRSSTASYYQADGIGSITSLSNGAGALVQTYTLDSFGNQTAAAGSLTNPFRYAGREFDTETNLYFYRARYYSPSLKRFVSEDPLKFGGGSVNFYELAFDDPTNYSDPSGMQAQPSPGIAPEPGPFPGLPGGLWNIPDEVPGPYTGPNYSNPGAPPAPRPPSPPPGWAGPGPAGHPSPAVPDPGPNYTPERTPGRCRNQNGCNPCNPPVGTISYRFTTERGHFPFTGGHWTLYEMHQSPAPMCGCFWEKLGVGQGPMPNFPHIGEPGGGGPQ